MEQIRVVAWALEMRHVHQRLTDAPAIAREAIESGTDLGVALGRLTDPLTYCWAFCTALDGHHDGEDEHLFPRLVAQRPELAEVVGNLSRDHRTIGHLLAELRHSMAAGQPSAELLRHLDGVEAVMTTHFRYEEKRLLGVLDESALPDLDPLQVFGPLAGHGPDLWPRQPPPVSASGEIET